MALWGTGASVTLALQGEVSTALIFRCYYFPSACSCPTASPYGIVLGLLHMVPINPCLPPSASKTWGFPPLPLPLRQVPWGGYTSSMLQLGPVQSPSSVHSLPPLAKAWYTHPHRALSSTEQVRFFKVVPWSWPLSLLHFLQWD